MFKSIIRAISMMLENRWESAKWYVREYLPNRHLWLDPELGLLTTIWIVIIAIGFALHWGAGVNAIVVGLISDQITYWSERTQNRLRYCLVVGIVIAGTILGVLIWSKVQDARLKEAMIRYEATTAPYTKVIGKVKPGQACFFAETGDYMFNNGGSLETWITTDDGTGYNPGHMTYSGSQAMLDGVWFDHEESDWVAKHNPGIEPCIIGPAPT